MAPKSKAKPKSKSKRARTASARSGTRSATTSRSKAAPPVSLPVSSQALVDLVLLGPTHDRRQLQDSPILGDVWLAFANKPSRSQDLLLSPYKSRSAGPVAATVSDRVHRIRSEPKSPKRGAADKAPDPSHVAYLQGLVAARLMFREVLQVLVPMTGWWRSNLVEAAFLKYEQDDGKKNALTEHIEFVLQWAKATRPDERDRIAKAFATFPTLDRYLSLAGLILWAGKQISDNEGLGDVITSLDNAEPIVEELWYLFQDVKKDLKYQTSHRDEPAGAAKPSDDDPHIWQIFLNRTVTPALDKSVPAVKGDAARTLFKVDCSSITWAVVDSGIQADHPVFGARVVRSFDFSYVRRIVSLDNLKLDPNKPDAGVTALIKDTGIAYADAVNYLKEIAKDAVNDRSINWALVERFVDITARAKALAPSSSHGTHVAGIIGANKSDDAGCSEGMCPDINLYDFRVINTGSTLADTEFAIISALQYIRYLNESRTFMSIHGVNLSLSIPHDVRNFACGRTPLCNECERLVESGVVVVAAAGNMGYHTFETRDGAYESYSAFSITDPGNADSVITVGATHRSWPHTYGVSFFSSRGPTGDGRMKPDLVAPGERISSSVTGGKTGQLDGTSMAAPHVSGAAAMLMARYAELIGRPRRIKDLLCETATDLGRERSFQGRGMLDVLRAFQRV